MPLKIRAILVVVIGLTMGFGLSLGGGILNQEKPLNSEELAWEQAQLFAEVLERVKRDYVEPIDDAELLESAIRGMVGDLDAHSEYLDAGEYRDIRISATGSYTGVGIEVAEIDGRIRIITPIAGTPAARAGVRSGDELIEIDGRSAETGRLQETLGQLRGSAGSKITLTVLREEKALDYEMHREVISVASVHKEFLSPSFGYVRVSQFSDSTARELSAAVDELNEANAGMLEGLILDLRNNPGGVLESAVDVSDLFLRFRRNRERGRSHVGRTIYALGAPRRHTRRRGTCYFGQQRFRFSIRNRRRCPAGSQSRDDRRHGNIWKGARADCNAVVARSGD